ncbi:MAG: alpha/beta hydrolase [Bacteroidota bacterium]
MENLIKKEQGFEYVEQGEGPVLLILHGLFGAMSNFADVVGEFSKDFRVLIPLMPIYEKSKFKPTCEGLTSFVYEFINFKDLRNISLLGNSLGGHIGLMYCLENQDRVSTLTLTGSSGLFESGMGSSFPKRGTYEYVKERVEYTFYSPDTATPELVDEVFRIVNDNMAALRILRFARSAQNHNMRNVVGKISVPTLLIWGLNDNITPPRVAYEFDALIPNTELHFIDHCSHAPMMEQPEEFNRILRSFLYKHTEPVAR